MKDVRYISFSLILLLLFIPAVFAADPKPDPKCANGFKELPENLPLQRTEMTFRWVGPSTGQPVVFIHAAGSSSRTFDIVAQKLGSNYRALLIDLRGHGESAARGNLYSSEQLANDVLALLRSLRVKPANIVAHSDGGKVAMQIAALAPDRVKSLVLLESDVIARTAQLSPEERSRYEELKGLNLFAREFSSPSDLTPILTNYFSAETALYLIEHRLTSGADGKLKLMVRPEVLFLFRKTVEAEDLSELLKRIKAPTLVLRSNPKTSKITDKGIGAYKENLLNVSIESWDDAGHRLHRDQPVRFIATLTDFWNSSVSLPTSTKPTEGQQEKPENDSAPNAQ